MAPAWGRFEEPNPSLDAAVEKRMLVRLTSVDVVVAIVTAMRVGFPVRFIAVTRPLSYARHKNSRRVLVTIVTTWIISAAVSSPIVLGINYTDRRREHPSLCTFYNADFQTHTRATEFHAHLFLFFSQISPIFRRFPRCRHVFSRPVCGLRLTISRHTWQAHTSSVKSGSRL